MKENQFLDIIKHIYKTYNVPFEMVNHFGVRSIINIEKDVWNDLICQFTENTLNIYLGTTDPSPYYNRPDKQMNKRGTMHLCHGYHKNIWTLGKHGKKGYPALVNRWNCGKQRVWRDVDKNMRFTNGDIYDLGIFGGNLHKRYNDSIPLSKGIKWDSAGCQVFAHEDNHDKCYHISKKSGQKFFSYMLFNKEEIPFYTYMLNKLK